MVSYSELKTGVFIIIDGQPYAILETKHVLLGRGRGHTESRIKNLITGSVLRRNFKQSDQFEEAEINYSDIKFLYNHKDQYFFSKPDDPKTRFSLTAEQLGDNVKYLKQNMVVKAFNFQDQLVNISVPIKVDLKVQEAPPGIKGDTAQGGTKTITLETGAQITAPLFINAGDIVKINTDTGQYVERVEKAKE